MDKAIEIIVTVIGIAVTTGLTINQLQRTISIRRARLKHDLEMLEIAKRLNLPTGHFQERLKKELESFVSDEVALEGRSPMLDPQFLGMSAFGILILIGFTVWTIYLVRDGFTWWSILTGFFALEGIVLPVLAWEDVQKKHKKSKSPPNKENPADAKNRAAD